MTRARHAHALRGARPATLSVWQAGACQTREIKCQPGNYPAYYAAVRDAVLGQGASPVSADEAIRVIGLLEFGLQSAHQKRVVDVVPALLD